MRSWYAIRARNAGAEVSIYDEIGAYGVSAKGFLGKLGALPEACSSARLFKRPPVTWRLLAPRGRRAAP